MGITTHAAVPLMAAFVAVLAGCAQEERPLPPEQAAVAVDEAGSTPQPTVQGIRSCSQARAGIPLPERLVAQSADAGTAAPLVLASDLFDRFNAVCAPCHTAAADPPGQGNFQIVQATDFRTLMTASVVQHITASVCPTTEASGSANDPMPPCTSNEGRTYASRPDSDPVKQFAVLVNEWLAAGSPLSFTPTGTMASSNTDGGPPPQFVATPQMADALTNMGNCIPSTALIGVEQTRSAALDAMFASAKSDPNGTPAQVIGLPPLLSQTDLFTLDSATLAEYGVVAYAPGYPLWTDNAGKLRYVRVPRGKSIRFDKTTQQFVIPANTRFYKTFMMRIVDTDGSYRYRKMETRLIVSRPDTNNPDGTATQNALFGTYQWNDNETQASLVTNPLHNGLPFADTTFLYHSDELLAADVLASGPADPELQLLNYGGARHYAIPSSQRCIQCHMGSPSQSFVLGFSPLQINRRPTGVGGVIEPTGPDELTQLQRFIDAGIVTGVDTPGDVLPLERSQGSRTPRNDYELTAQGYMLGNCAHCHNPRGYPNVQNQQLTNFLSFLPASGPIGGIFQFPLEKFSPRIFRGPSGSEPIPYITPSLVDLPRTNPYTGAQDADPFMSNPGLSTTATWVDYAPWRSIIYRNVDSPFAYVDDVAIFPHMPMNGVSYDPRAKQLLGNWMVSIPAIRKRPDIPEYAYQLDDNPADNFGGMVVDTSFQPYAEVLPGDPHYGAAVEDAATRLQIFQSGVNPAIPTDVAYSRYQDPGQTQDILDPAVLVNPVCQPVPVPNETLYHNPLPEHPHWVNTDLTAPPGDWAPRQPNWNTVLVEQNLPTPASVSGQCTASTSALSALDDQIKAIKMLPNAHLSDIQPYADTPQPFGLWQVQPGCKLSGQHTVQDYTGATRPHWMDVTNPPASAPVYTQTPGQAVFKMICINCHGPDGTANGRLAQNLATMTGGGALVANFRDGMFGPVGASDSTNYRGKIFSILPGDASAAWTVATVDDRAARYMAWMGLGGTPVNIPVEVLQVVAVTKVLDQPRVLPSSSLSANMLSEAKSLCRSLLLPAGNQTQFFVEEGHGYFDSVPNVAKGLNGSVVWTNGDADLWMHLCSLANPPPIRVLTMPREGATALAPGDVLFDGTFKIVPGTLLAPTVYPPNTPVGNERGGTPDPSLSDTNLWPWCVDDRKASSADQTLIAKHVPVCPPSVLTASDACPAGSCLTTDDANQWAVRGGVNAGMAVFLYLRSIENSGPLPDFNQCNLLH